MQWFRKKISFFLLLGLFSALNSCFFDKSRQESDSDEAMAFASDNAALNLSNDSTEPCQVFNQPNWKSLDGDCPDSNGPVKIGITKKIIFAASTYTHLNLQNIVKSRIDPKVLCLLSGHRWQEIDHGCYYEVNFLKTSDNFKSLFCNSQTQACEIDMVKLAKSVSAGDYIRLNRLELLQQDIFDKCSPSTIEMCELSPEEINPLSEEIIAVLDLDRNINWQWSQPMCVNHVANNEISFIKSGFKSCFHSIWDGLEIVRNRILERIKHVQEMHLDTDFSQDSLIMSITINTTEEKCNNLGKPWQYLGGYECRSQAGISIFQYDIVLESVCNQLGFPWVFQRDIHKCRVLPESQVAFSESKKLLIKGELNDQNEILFPLNWKSLPATQNLQIEIIDGSPSDPKFIIETERAIGDFSETLRPPGGVTIYPTRDNFFLKLNLNGFDFMNNPAQQ